MIILWNFVCHSDLLFAKTVYLSLGQQAAEQGTGEFLPVRYLGGIVSLPDL